jgi:hypothetical protein
MVWTGPTDETAPFSAPTNWQWGVENFKDKDTKHVWSMVVEWHGYVATCDLAAVRCRTIPPHHSVTDWHCIRMLLEQGF